MSSDSDLTDLRERVAEMEKREQRLMELLNTKEPERIEHDLRNVLNELGLLRTMFDQMGSKDELVC